MKPSRRAQDLSIIQQWYMTTFIAAGVLWPEALGIASMGVAIVFGMLGAMMWEACSEVDDVDPWNPIGFGH